VVDRPRLNRVLDSALVRICIVHGPSGGGKTTLLRSWALTRPGERRATWVSLRPGMTTRQGFWQHVAASARRHGDLSAEAASRVGAQLDAGGDPVRIAVALLAEAGPVTIVLDAYEHLGQATAEVDTDLAHLVSALPELRVMITTRASTSLADVDPPGGVVRMITLGELALTPQEISDLITVQTGIQDDRLAQAVARATKGFALTVRSVVLALSQLGHIPHADSMEWSAIVAARWESLLPDPVAVQFVTDTSVAPYIDAELGELLSGNPETVGLLEMLERNGFGRWIPYARQHPVFQYAETIRDTFRARAGDDRDRFRRSCAAVARWLFDHDDVDQALQFAIDGEDFAFADRVFVALVISNPDTYITDRFLPSLRDVPTGALAAHPMLAFGLGLAMTANPMLRSEAPRIFRIAVDSPAAASYLEPDVDAFSLAAMRAVALRLANSFRESAEASAEVVRSLDSIPPATLASYGEHVGTILRQLSYSLLQGGRIEESIAAIDRSVALCRTESSRNYSIVYAAGASAFAGDLARAAAFLGAVDQGAWPRALRGTYLEGLGVVADCYRRLDALDFAGALQLLQDTDCYTPMTEFWPFLTAISVAARQGLGQAWAEADRVTRELSGRTPPGVGDNVATEHLVAALARAWMAAGDHEAARDLLARMPADSPHLAPVRISRLVGSGRGRDALTVAEAAMDLPRHTLRTRAETWTTGAVAALAGDLPDLAWMWLNCAAVAYETYGTRMHVALMPRRDRWALWELARERGSASLERYLDVPAGSRQANTGPTVVLTPRESVVLGALAEHDSIREVAQALVVSPHTIKSQLQGVYRKLGVSSRHAALAVAQELGMIDDAAPPV
jgi:LuxR family maltose regulon positive regulatory protein